MIYADRIDDPTATAEVVGVGDRWPGLEPPRDEQGRISMTFQKKGRISMEFG